MRFRVAAPDGTKFAATATTWYRASTAAGTTAPPAARSSTACRRRMTAGFRTFTASGGEVAVTYSDAGVFADFGAPRTVIDLARDGECRGQQDRGHAGCGSDDPARRARFGEHPAAADLGGRGRRRSADRGGHQQRARQLRQHGDRRHAPRAHRRGVVSPRRRRLAQRLARRRRQRRRADAERRPVPHLHADRWRGAGHLLAWLAGAEQRLDRDGGARGDDRERVELRVRTAGRSPKGRSCCRRRARRRSQRRRCRPRCRRRVATIDRSSRCRT